MGQQEVEIIAIVGRLRSTQPTAMAGEPNGCTSQEQCPPDLIAHKCPIHRFF